jgi:hypothetical protein
MDLAAIAAERRATADAGCCEGDDSVGIDISVEHEPLLAATPSIQQQLQGYRRDRREAATEQSERVARLVQHSWSLPWEPFDIPPGPSSIVLPLRGSGCFVAPGGCCLHPPAFQTLPETITAAGLGEHEYAAACETLVSHALAWQNQALTRWARIVVFVVAVMVAAFHQGGLSTFEFVVLVVSIFCVGKADRDKGLMNEEVFERLSEECVSLSTAFPRIRFSLQQQELHGLALVLSIPFVWVLIESNHRRGLTIV